MIIRDGKPLRALSTAEAASQDAMWASHRGRTRWKVRREYTNLCARSALALAAFLSAQTPGTLPNVSENWLSKFKALKAEMDAL